jgi:dihydroflavonol-4-reductase
MSETVLLTGVSGFIAKHVALKLLNAGYDVRGTLRQLDRANEVHAALAPHLLEQAGQLTLVQADLEADAGWAEAMAGVSAVVHTASPFPITQPKNPQELIRPAVEGTRRVLAAAAAAGVKRIVLTSSVAAVVDLSKGEHLQDEADWCDPSKDTVTAYEKSKTLAERAAWELAKARGLALTTINPGFVLGPPLDEHYGSSLGLVERFLKGKDPMVPPMGLAIVDVRDVAEMHLRALQRPETAGKRYIASAGAMAFVDMARMLKSTWPTRRIPTREAPRAVMKLLAIFDPSIRTILPRLGHMDRLSNARAVREMGMEFIGPKAALMASAEWLVKHGKAWA